MGRSTVFQHVGDLFGGRARLSRLPRHSDERGTLIPVNPPHLPFRVARAFVIEQVPPGTSRGGHAHRTARQFLVAPAGRVEVEMHFRSEEATVVLGAEGDALLIERGVWSRQTYLEETSRLVVFADEDYDQTTYLDGGPGEGA